jgi:hypothetical protein
VGAGEALADDALDRHDELVAAALGDVVGLRRVGGVDDDLGDPVAVAEVEKDQVAVVATGKTTLESSR